MHTTPQQVIRTYLTLQFGNMLAASLIWGINTLFLLSAGLNNFEAFVANAFFTLGMVLFEIPTGIVADSRGRRTSYLLGTVTLVLSTVLYYLLWTIHAPLWEWGVASLLLGLGFTFFSGATEAWLVDALAATGYKGKLETVFGRGQVVVGAAMLVGTFSGGVIAQFTTIGVPYILRGAILILMFAVAWRLMHDVGFTPDRSRRPLAAMRTLLRLSIQNGLKVPPIRWLMLSGLFASGVGIYSFYALQPYLLDLYGDPTAYTIAGLTAMLVAVAQICGGILAGRIGHLFKKRTTALILFAVASAALLVGMYLIPNFYLALVIVFLWGLVYAATMPIRQSYLNGMIPSSQRATVLSFDSMMSNTGGIFIQPVLARSADVWNYGTSFAIGAALQLLAVPMLVRSRRAKHRADSQ